MCSSKPKPTEEPAAPPAPPLTAPDPPFIGDSRREETRNNHGSDAPNFRVKRSKAATTVKTPDVIRM